MPNSLGWHLPLPRAQIHTSPPVDETRCWRLWQSSRRSFHLTVRLPTRTQQTLNPQLYLLCRRPIHTAA